MIFPSHSATTPYTAGCATKAFISPTAGSGEGKSCGKLCFCAMPLNASKTILAHSWTSCGVILRILISCPITSPPWRSPDLRLVRNIETDALRWKNRIHAIHEVAHLVAEAGGHPRFSHAGAVCLFFC